MKKTFFIIILLCSVSMIYAAGNKEKHDGRYIEKRNFSIAVPETWDVLKIRETKYNVLRGTFENNFAPSINFVDENFNGNFDVYVEYFMDEIDNLFGENREYIVISDFNTINGLRGKLIVITTYQQEKLIQFNFFLFPGSNRRNMVITCTNLAIENARFNELFVNTVRTFEWLR
ncbi:MAG: hypothetical protein FWD47_11065 [Treponema sp.]|nr:hypothetical protein [Treponema sp.]